MELCTGLLNVSVKHSNLLDVETIIFCMCWWAPVVQLSLTFNFVFAFSTSNFQMPISLAAALMAA